MKIVGLDHLKMAVMLAVEGQNPGAMVCDNTIQAAVHQSGCRQLIGIEHNNIYVVAHGGQPLLYPLDQGLGIGQTAQLQLFGRLGPGMLGGIPVSLRKAPG